MINKVSDIEIKSIDGAQGIIEAVVNTMGVKDSDGDVIDPTAFNKSIENNLPIPVLSGHDQHQIVGKVVSAYPLEKDEGVYQLYAKMQMNMDTQNGQEAFSNIAGGYVREWSVGFNIPENGVEMSRQGRETTRTITDLDWVETSSVVRGASPETATISAKEEKPKKPRRRRYGAIRTHTTETTSGEWHGSSSRSSLSSDIDALREAYAWFNIEGKPDSKGSYKFIHHHVEDGKVGAANVRACSGAIGALNGSRAGTSIPKGDREAVYKHLAKHIKDAGKEPPELYSDSRVWSRVSREATTEYGKILFHLLNSITKEEADDLTLALAELEFDDEENDTEDENLEDVAENAVEDDVDEAFDEDTAQEELLALAERQLNLLRTILDHRNSIQE